MIDVNEKKKVILSFLEKEGPSLPVRIAKTIGMDPVFASAIISELVNSKEVMVSHMKVGSSPLYFLPGDEKRLEAHKDNLKSIEIEAYNLLKKEGILVDEELEPSLRVALRSLKDFAESKEKDGKLVWKLIFAEEKEEPQEEEPEKEEEEKTLEEPGREEDNNVLNEKEREPKKETKVEPIFESSKKPDFFGEVKGFLERAGLNIVEEIQTEKREVSAIVSMPTPIGESLHLLVAKNKQSLSKEEVNSSLQRASYHKMPCIIVIKKKPSKQISKFIEDNHYISILTLESSS